MLGCLVDDSKKWCPPLYNLHDPSGNHWFSNSPTDLAQMRTDYFAVCPGTCANARFVLLVLWVISGIVSLTVPAFVIFSRSMRSALMMPIVPCIL